MSPIGRSSLTIPLPTSPFNTQRKVQHFTVDHRPSFNGFSEHCTRYWNAFNATFTPAQTPHSLPQLCRLYINLLRCCCIPFLCFSYFIHSVIQPIAILKYAQQKSNTSVRCRAKGIRFVIERTESMRGKEGLQLLEVEVTVPPQFKCPISLELMKDPVTLCTGITYDRHAIEKWLDAGNNVCPVTNQRLHAQHLIPNHTLRRLIQQWCLANRFNGIQRIPTPTVPLDSAQLTHILSAISKGDAQAVEKLASLAAESHRNRKCIASAPDTAPILTKALIHHRQSLRICEHALAVLAAVLPISDGRARGLLTSSDALRCITTILHGSNLEGRSNAASIVKELAADGEYRQRIGAADGLAEGLVRLVKESTCPATTKSGLTAIYLIAGSGKTRVKLVEGGAIPVVLEILPEAERGVCERCMAVLDVLCTSTQGRSAAYEHALTVPVTVKKLLRVSALTDERAVSILWRMCHNSSTDSVLLEAMAVGAFQKLLVLVQMDCTQKTRERATGLLKLFNNCASGKWDECTDSLDMKQLQRSF